MNSVKKALENTFFISLSWIITTLGGFLFWLIAGKFLNQQDYGIALTATSLGFFIISVITLGLPSALSKLIPEYKSRKKYEKIKEMITLSLSIILFANILTISILIILKNQIMSLIKVSENIYYLIIIYVFVGSFSTTFYNITYSFQEMKKYFIVGSISVLSKLIIATTILFLGFRYFGPIIGVIFSSIITLILCFPKKRLKKIKSFFDEDLFKYAITGFIGALVASMLTNFHYTIVTILKSNVNTGIFGVAMMVSSVTSAIPYILNISIYPIISETFRTKSKKIIPILLENTIKYSILFGIPLIITFLILSNFIVLSFSSYKFLDSARLVPILTLATFFLSISNIFVNTLFAIRKPKIYIKILLFTALIFILLTIPLTYFYSEFGMSVGYLITNIIYFILSLYQVRKFVDFGINIKKVLSIFVASTSFIILYLAKPNTIFSVIFYTSLNFIVYFLILFLLNFFSKEDYEIIKYFAKKLKFNQK
ncbi:MAG: oligosaccharide flippase family protein [Candidatus Woesearchaeota archaeon]